MEASRYVGRVREKRGYRPWLLMETVAAENGDPEARRRLRQMKRNEGLLGMVLEFVEKQAKSNGLRIDFSSNDPAMKTLSSLWSLGFEQELERYLRETETRKTTPTCPTCGKSWQEGRDADCWNEFHALENKP